MWPGLAPWHWLVGGGGPVHAGAGSAGARAVVEGGG